MLMVDGGLLLKGSAAQRIWRMSSLGKWWIKQRPLGWLGFEVGGFVSLLLLLRVLLLMFDSSSITVMAFSVLLEVPAVISSWKVVACRLQSALMFGPIFRHSYSKETRTFRAAYALSRSRDVAQPVARDPVPWQRKCSAI